MTCMTERVMNGCSSRLQVDSTLSLSLFLCLISYLSSFFSPVNFLRTLPHDNENEARTRPSLPLYLYDCLPLMMPSLDPYPLLQASNVITPVILLLLLPHWHTWCVLPVCMCVCFLPLTLLHQAVCLVPSLRPDSLSSSGESLNFFTISIYISAGRVRAPGGHKRRSNKRIPCNKTPVRSSGSFVVVVHLKFRFRNALHTQRPVFSISYRPWISIISFYYHIDKRTLFWIFEQGNFCCCIRWSNVFCAVPLKGKLIVVSSYQGTGEGHR